VPRRRGIPSDRLVCAEESQLSPQPPIDHQGLAPPTHFAYYNGRSLEYKEPTIRVVGPAAPIVRFNFVGSIIYDGKKTPQNLHILMNVAEAGQHCKLLSRAATSSEHGASYGWTRLGCSIRSQPPFAAPPWSTSSPAIGMGAVNPLQHGPSNRLARAADRGLRGISAQAESSRRRSDREMGVDPVCGCCARTLRRTGQATAAQRARVANSFRGLAGESLASVLALPIRPGFAWRHAH